MKIKIKRPKTGSFAKITTIEGKRHASGVAHDKGGRRAAISVQPRKARNSRLAEG